MSGRKGAKRPGVVEQMHAVKQVVRDLRLVAAQGEDADWRGVVARSAATLEQSFCARGGGL